MTDWLIDERMNQPTYQSTNQPTNTMKQAENSLS